MARRFSGNLRVYVQYVGGSYKGLVHVPGKGNWLFEDLRVPYGGPPNSSEAYDRAAESALTFGSFYTTDNRSDAPDWAPPAELADEINGNMEYAPDYKQMYQHLPGVYVGDSAVVFRSLDARERYYQTMENFFAKQRSPELTLVQGGNDVAA